MTIISPDVSSRLKPDLIPVVYQIYSEFCNLQPHARVLVITDARTPSHVAAAFQGVALALGADAATIETSIPAGGPTYQPGAKWTPMLAHTAKAADLIVDLGVGYADFIAEALARGARVIMPGDGIGNPYLEDILIRTLRDIDVHAVRRQADRIASMFSAANTCKLLSGEGDELLVDITGLTGASVDGFLWDKDKQTYKSNYGILPPACPGVFLPLGRAHGTVSIDGTLLWHPVYHEQPRGCLRLRFDDSRLVEIRGDPYLSNRLRNWLDELGDEGSWRGPVHLNIGINPNALFTQNQEWERVYGSVTCGMGDMPAALFAPDSDLKWSRSSVHWDWTILQPTVLLDGQVIAQNGKLQAPALAA